MSTMLFGRDYFKSIAEKLTYLSEVDFGNMKTIIGGEYKSIRHFINDCAKHNLRSYRIAYKHLPRYRLEKLPATRKIVANSDVISELVNFVQVLKRLAYNLDYECKPLNVLKAVCDEIITQMIESEKIPEGFKPRSTMYHWEFKVLYKALEKLKFNGFVHCGHSLKDINFEGFGHSLNQNNKMFYGLKRLVGGLRAVHYRSLGLQTTEKFNEVTYDMLEELKIKRVLIIALKYIVILKKRTVGEVNQEFTDALTYLFSILTDDYVHNRNI